MTTANNWPLVRLERVITDMQPGFARRPNAENVGTPQLRTNNVSPEGAIDLSEVKYVNATEDETDKYGVQRGDVIFNNTNSPEWVGKTAYFDLDGEYVISNHMTRLRVNEALIEPHFLARYLHYLWQIRQSWRWAKHWVNQAAIDQNGLAKFQVPLPPLPEQRRIVDILQEADDLRQLRRQANEKAQELLPALFYEMFGDPLNNEKDWKTKEIKEMGAVTTGNTPPRNRPEYYGDFIDWVKSDDLDSSIGYVTRSKERLSEKGAKRGRVVPKESTLIACIAGSFESIGKAALADRELAFNQQINAVTPFEDVNPYFFFAVVTLSKSLIQAKSTKGMKKIVNKSRLESVKLISPPKALQDEFSAKLLEVFALKFAQSDTVDFFEEMFQSILARAFLGQLTTKWREQHEPELSSAATERDYLLGQAHRVAPTLKPQPALLTALQKQRNYLQVELSQGQRDLLATINGIEDYFVPDDLADKYDLDPEVVRAGLHLFAELGLVRAVSLPALAADEKSTVYVPAYRALRPKDDIRLDDLAWLEAPAP